jgi:hypothetical protein
MVGDVMLGRGVDEAIRGMRLDEPWGDALSVLDAADLRVINLGCAIGQSTHLELVRYAEYAANQSGRSNGASEAAGGVGLGGHLLSQ